MIRESYEHLNALADSVMTCIIIPDLAKLCVLYVTTEFLAFETTLLKTMLARKYYDYHLKYKRLIKELRGSSHPLLQEYMRLVAETTCQFSGLNLFHYPFFSVTLGMNISGPLAYVFYYITAPRAVECDYSLRTCRRRHCFMARACICGEPIN